MLVSILAIVWFLTFLVMASLIVFLVVRKIRKKPVTKIKRLLIADIICSVLLLVFIGVVSPPKGVEVSGAEEPARSVSVSTSSTNPPQTMPESTLNPTLELSAPSSEVPESEEIAKTVAILMDSQLIGFVENSQEIIVLLQEGIDLLQSTNDVVSLYSLADTAEDSQRSLQTSLRSVRDNDNKDYVSAVEQYIINGQLICEKLKKYLDGGSLENLTDIQNRLKFSESYYGDVLDARKDYLLSQGLSESEIAEIFMK